ncbi:MAG: ABC transporter permease [Chloroflexi bacterium]|nr:MAG: ABC transporter permease [Chloroflexota bacterium]
MISEGQAAQAVGLGRETVHEGRPARSFWLESWDRLREDRIGVTAAGLVVFLGLVALAAPVLSALVTHHGYQDQDLDHTFAPPLAPGHLLGTDDLGHDTLTRLIWGARVSLSVGLLTVAISLAVGTTVGLVAGYYGGALDEVLMRAVDVLLSIPAVFLFILVSILFFRQPSALTVSLVLASVGWGGTARLVRAEALTIRGRDFMVATRSIGAGDRRLIVRHLLPNALPTLVVVASLGVGGVILAEAALDFLGFGIHPPTPSWGNMLSNAQGYFTHSIWLVFLPGTLIFLTVLAFNLLGNAVRDAFDPRLR